MMKENLIQEYYEKVMKSETPHLILAAYYQALFQKSVQAGEWGLLRKSINLYGREIVFSALSHTAASTTVDVSKSLWPYINSVAMRLAESNNKMLAHELDIEQSLRRTQDLIEGLRIINTDKINLITVEEFYGGTTTK